MSPAQLRQATQGKYIDELPEEIVTQLQRYRPHWKEIALHQKGNNLILLGIALAMTLIAIGSVIYARYKVTQITHLNTTLRQQVDIGLQMTLAYANREDAVLNTPPKMYVLSKKTADCVAAQPEVANKIKLKWGDTWDKAADLICRESSFIRDNINKSSGACGLGQALPCDKMKCDLQDVDCQLAWIDKYVLNRYGTLQAAIYFHDMKGWY